MSEYQNNSIFWVETLKIEPNPFQPRREFEPHALEDLADSIRQYGILQPLVVTRKETLRPDNNGMDVSYELIAGERRLRASKIAGLQQVPVIIRKETDSKIKLELAIIENLQREDLNPIDRALAFEQLYKEFNLTHIEIGKRMGKSRVYVSNSLRLLSLPEEIKKGLMAGRISEGHTRPLLMLTDRPEEQGTLYKEIMVKKMSVRDAEKVARKIAQDRVRKKEFVVDPKIRAFEKQLAENLGTRVHIEPKEKGGKITIDYFTLKDLESILGSMQKVEREQSMMESYLSGQKNNAQEELEKTTSFEFNSNKIQNIPEKNIKTPVVHHRELPEYHKHPDTEITLAALNIKEHTSPNETRENNNTPLKEPEVPEIKDLQVQEIQEMPEVLGKNIIDNVAPEPMQIHKPSQQWSAPETQAFSNAQIDPYQEQIEYQNDDSIIQPNEPQPPQQSYQTTETQYNEQGYNDIPQNPQQTSYYQHQAQNQNQIHYQQPVRKKSLFGRIFG